MKKEKWLYNVTRAEQLWEELSYLHKKAKGLEAERLLREEYKKLIEEEIERYTLLYKRGNKKANSILQILQDCKIENESSYNNCIHLQKIKKLYHEIMDN